MGRPLFLKKQTIFLILWLDKKKSGVDVIDHFIRKISRRSKRVTAFRKIEKIFFISKTPKRFLSGVKFSEKKSVTTFTPHRKKKEIN